MKKVIVFSGINITSGGPLTILRNVMAFANENLSKEYEVYALVKSKDVLGSGLTGIHVIEFPDAQKTFFHKLYYEYFYFRKLSTRLNVFLWMSLNDCTPSVNAKLRCVYIHNATSVYKFSSLDFRFPSRILLQKFYYPLFLRKNLSENDVVVVQQKWLADFVVNSLGYKRKECVLLHRPEFALPQSDSHGADNNASRFFIYPTKPEVYKNIHTLIDGFTLLGKENNDYTLILTIDGTENAYARYLKRKAASNSAIIFAGAMPFDELMRKINSAQALVFPSRLETWGLPLSEARALKKFIMASEMPYARETLSGYRNVLYFNADSPREITAGMQRIIEEKISYLPDEGRETEQPMGLEGLFKQILDKKNRNVPNA